LPGPLVSVPPTVFAALLSSTTGCQTFFFLSVLFFFRQLSSGKTFFSVPFPKFPKFRSKGDLPLTPLCPPRLPPLFGPTVALAPAPPRFFSTEKFFPPRKNFLFVFGPTTDLFFPYRSSCPFLRRRIFPAVNRRDSCSYWTFSHNHLSVASLLQLVRLPFFPP